MTIAHWIEQASARLREAGIDGASTEAWVIAAHVLGVERSWLVAHSGEEFPELAGEALLQKRLDRQPLAYLLGKREFYGREFIVGPGVLIPRQETETLVEEVLGDSPHGARVLDLGTGSGCIGITVKLERPDLEVVLGDVSERALSIAEHNADLLGASVRLVLSDGFQELLGEAFDRIVTNPPYIGRAEPLMPEVKDHEPSEALYSGDTGMEFYERLAREASGHLLDGGRLFMEVGYSQATAVRSLFEQQGWQHVKTAKDLSGVERVVVAQAVNECAVPG